MKMSIQTVVAYIVSGLIVCLIFAPTCAPSLSHCMRNSDNEQTEVEEEDEEDEEDEEEADTADRNNGQDNEPYSNNSFSDTSARIPLMIIASVVRFLKNIYSHYPPMKNLPLDPSNSSKVAKGPNTFNEEAAVPAFKVNGPDIRANFDNSFSGRSAGTTLMS